MRILVAQLNPIIGDIQGNLQKILKGIASARAKGGDIILFPELTLCGYPPEDLLLHPSFVLEQEKALDQVVKGSSGLMVVVGVVRRSDGEKGLFNSAAIIQDGRLVGFEDKRLLPTYDVFDERRYFEPGKEVRIWKYLGKKIGVLICEDIWQHAGFVGDTDYARDPVLDLLEFKPDIVLNLSASPYQFQKPDMRVKVCHECAKTLKCPVVLCCQVGGNDQLVFDGYSLFVGEKGELRQVAKGFEEDEMIVDLEVPSCPCPFSYDPVKDLYSALVLGVRDYFHKQGFRKGCLGLSGGIDSALVACIAVDALGKENVMSVGMPSRYSSKESVQDAKLLAQRLGIGWKEVSIDGIFQDFLTLLSPSFEGMAPDVTEENLQARIRGMILMAISNKLGYLVLSTGNKSELGLGYCTLYGDMCGGLGVISDVTKEQVYMLAHFVNKTEEVIPQAILDKPPSAELRPGQKDTDSLPEYSVVDTVLQGYVEEFLSPEAIAEQERIPLEVVKGLVKKIHLAEYKRRQAPPGIRVSKKAFHVGRRYPIVQGWH